MISRRTFLGAAAAAGALPVTAQAIDIGAPWRELPSHLCARIRRRHGIFLFGLTGRSNWADRRYWMPEDFGTLPSGTPVVVAEVRDGKYEVLKRGVKRVIMDGISDGHRIEYLSDADDTFPDFPE